MHGLFFVTWERYLGRRFGQPVLEDYRRVMGATSDKLPLSSRVYDDRMWLAGLDAACELTQVAVNTLLYEYGSYFIVNGLTRRQCAYLLNQVFSGRDLLLQMRDAHLQMRKVNDAVRPPGFEYEAVPGDPDSVVLHYNSPRQLCRLLHGAIEGAADLFGEQVRVSESQCMQRGAPECIFRAHFFPGPDSLSVSQRGDPQLVAQQRKRWQERRVLAHAVYRALPTADGMTLAQIQQQLRQQHVDGALVRPFLILEAITLLHHAGWVTSSAIASAAPDGLDTRRYWRLAPAAS